MAGKTRAEKITRNTGEAWGLICLLPAGWIIFLVSIIRRKNDVIKYKTLDAKLALEVLHNYIRSFIIACFIAAGLCLISFVNNHAPYYYFPNIIPLIVVPIVYNVVVGKILNFAEEKQLERDQK